MKYYTSYFYNIRFFTPNMIPFSTAIWDPKWFHDNKDPKYTFLDKNGVINGLRIKELRPGESCQNLCRGPEHCQSHNGENRECDFLHNYGQQLESINYTKFEEYFYRVSRELKKKMGFLEEPVIVFIVHEAPDNPCSEREKILEVLPKHGIDITEWQRN